MLAIFFIDVIPVGQERRICCDVIVLALSEYFLLRVHAAHEFDLLLENGTFFDTCSEITRNLT
mgnify:CR=1 FL=1